MTKEKRKDGQINAFTGEAYNYAVIITSDRDATPDEIVHFYNQRGTTEKEFDVLKNDFGWNNLPFPHWNRTWFIYRSWLFAAISITTSFMRFPPGSRAFL
ncbi:MAG: transposase [Owenweeksia sp.]|nr:transposase [Owenweeksia sp.]